MEVKWVAVSHRGRNYRGVRQPGANRGARGKKRGSGQVTTGHLLQALKIKLFKTQCVSDVFLSAKTEDQTLNVISGIVGGNMQG